MIFHASPILSILQHYGAPTPLMDWSYNPDVALEPFFCYNICKDLADYIRRTIKFKGVDNAYIYPELKSFARKVKEDVLNRKLATLPPVKTTRGGGGGA